MFEETIRIPMIWNLPGVVPSGRAPAAMVSSYDYLPMLFEMLGLPPLRDPQLVGRSFAPIVRGGSIPDWPQRVFVEYSYARGIRTRRYKYILKGDHHPDEFYDLATDPGERHNLAADPKYTSRAAGFRDDLDTWFAARGAPPVADWRSRAKNMLDPQHYPERK